MCGWSATQVARRWSSESCIPPSAVSCSKCHPTEGSCCFQACKYRTAWVNTTSVTAFASILECSFDVPLPPLPKERAARRPPCRSSPTTYGRACRQRRLCSPPWRPVVDERFCVAVVEEGALLARPAPLLLALGGREGGLLLAALAGRSARGRALHQVPPFFPCFSFLFLSACFTVHLLFSASTHGRVASARGGGVNAPRIHPWREWPACERERAGLRARTALWPRPSTSGPISFFLSYVFLFRHISIPLDIIC